MHFQSGGHLVVVLNIQMNNRTEDNLMCILLYPQINREQRAMLIK